MPIPKTSLREGSRERSSNRYPNVEEEPEQSNGKRDEFVDLLRGDQIFYDETHTEADPHNDENDIVIQKIHISYLTFCKCTLCLREFHQKKVSVRRFLP